MMQQVTGRSAKSSWFDPSGPHLLGQRCQICSSVFFPPELAYCGNPECDGEEFEISPLASKGTVWSWTTNHYKPPPPAISAEPFEPYTVVAVELREDGLIVLGQLSANSEAVAVGDTVDLHAEALVEDADGTQLVWRWARTPAVTR